MLAGLVALTLIWGVNWPVMKYSLRELSPLYLRAATMSGGTLLLLAWLLARGESLRVAPALRGPLAWLALPNVFGWHLCAILGIQALASGRAAILGFTMPIWTALLSLVFLRERLTWRLLVSCLGAGAAIALLLGQELSSLSGQPLGVLWMQAAALVWAVGTLAMRRVGLPLPVSVIAFWMMALSSLLFWVVAAFSEPWPAWRFSAPMWMALLWGSAVNYGIAQILWFWLARDLPPTASTFSVMAVPVVGTLSATVIVHEMPKWQDAAAIAFVSIAIAAALLGRQSRP